MGGGKGVWVCVRGGREERRVYVEEEGGREGGREGGQECVHGYVRL